MHKNPYSPPQKDTAAADYSFFQRAYRFGVVLVGLTLATIGLLGTLVAAFSMLDPTGAQLANDADPFGAPPSLVEQLLSLGLCVALTVGGAFLVLRVGRKRARQKEPT